MEWINKIRESFNIDRVYYTYHAKFEMENEEFGSILDREVYETIQTGEVIEEYLKDRPYPGFLIFGKTNVDRPLHIVCSYNEEEKTAIVITVYQPNPDLWIDYEKRRK